MVLFIEFGPSQYSELIHNLAKNGSNLLFVNRRRPAIWNLKSIRLLRKNRCKIASPPQFLSYKEKKNYTLDHFEERLEIYKDEKFPFRTYKIDLKT